MAKWSLRTRIIDLSKEIKGFLGEYLPQKHAGAVKAPFLSRLDPVSGKKAKPGKASPCQH
jgi:hypothetical protein